jgi:hypothetical protein
MPGNLLVDKSKSRPGLTIWIKPEAVNRCRKLGFEVTRNDEEPSFVFSNSGVIVEPGKERWYLTSYDNPGNPEGAVRRIAPEDITDVVFDSTGPITLGEGRHTIDAGTVVVWYVGTKQSMGMWARSLDDLVEVLLRAHSGIWPSSYRYEPKD